MGPNHRGALNQAAAAALPVVGTPSPPRTPLIVWGPGGLAEETETETEAVTPTNRGGTSVVGTHNWMLFYREKPLRRNLSVTGTRTED